MEATACSHYIDFLPSELYTAEEDTNKSMVKACIVRTQNAPAMPNSKIQAFYTYSLTIVR